MALPVGLQMQRENPIAQTHDLVQRALRACDGVPLFAEFLIPGAIAALEAGKKKCGS